MIIVSGYLRLDPGQRSDYLRGCDEVTRAARSAPGCVDFHLTADPLEDDRVNIFEQWDSAEDVEAFRGAGPSNAQQAAVTGASVMQHEVATSTPLT
jgi:quinol monooxygenase YgiN